MIDEYGSSFFFFFNKEVTVPTHMKKHYFFNLQQGVTS